MGMLTLLLSLTTTGAVAAPPAAKKPWEHDPQVAWTIELQQTDGVGISCATATQDPNAYVRRWTEGLWSGLNVATASIAGHTTDNAGMFAEIKLDCDKAPSEKFIRSVYQTWQRMRAAGK
jgi:hypothetical protein